MSSTESTDCVVQASDVMGLPMPVFRLDVDGDAITFADVNTALLSATRIDASEIIGKTPHEVFSKRLADTLTANSKACVDRRAVHRYEEHIDLASGAQWWDTTLTPRFDHNGTVVMIVGVALDISARKQREIELSQEASKARALVDEIQLFSSMAAHDLRGPLRKIDTLTHLTLSGFEDLADGKRGMIQLTQGITRGALSTVDSMLGYAQALTTEVRTPEPIDVGHIVRDIVALVDPEGDFEIAVPSGMIDGETVVLQLILRNLIDNAARHARGEIRVEIDTDDRGMTTLLVSDDGPGFLGGNDAFVKTINAGSNMATRSGFGIAAIKHLVDARNGTITLAPSRLGGASVAVSLASKARTFPHPCEIGGDATEACAA